MISQFAIPLVIIEGNFAGLEVLFGNFAFTPGFAAVEIVKFTFGIGVPSVEKLARISALGFAAHVTLSHHLLRQLVCVFLIQFIRYLDLPLGIIQRY